MGKSYSIPTLPLAFDVESKEILRQVNKANRALAELKGVATTIPNEAILINTLTLQEAKESSEIENIVTTQDDLYKAEIDVGKQLITAATKEVLRYRETLQLGFQLVKEEAQLSNKIVKKIQMYLVGNQAGFAVDELGNQAVGGAQVDADLCCHGWLPEKKCHFKCGQAV